MTLPERDRPALYHKMESADQIQKFRSNLSESDKKPLKSQVIVGFQLVCYYQHIEVAVQLLANNEADIYLERLNVSDNCWFCQFGKPF